MMITETKLAIKVQPKIVAEKPPEVERRRVYVLSADVEAHGHMGSCPGYALLTSPKPRKDEFRERVGTIIERTLTAEARIDTCDDRIAETERVEEKSSNWARCSEEPGDKRWWAVGGSTCGRIWRLHHREPARREKNWETSKLAKEDQRQQVKNNRTNGGRQNDLSKKLRMHQHLPIHMLLWSILREVRHQVGRGPYLCRSQVGLMTTFKFLRWMPSTRRMDERIVTSEKCWSGIEEKMSEISRKVNQTELDMSQRSREEDLENHSEDSEGWEKSENWEK